MYSLHTFKFDFLVNEASSGEMFLFLDLFLRDRIIVFSMVPLVR